MDSYIRMELSDQENDFFEAHLLSCADCLKELEERNRVIESAELYFAKETFGAQKTFETQKTFGAQKRRSTRSKRIRYLVVAMAAAASVLLLIGIMFYPARDQTLSPSQAVNKDKVLDTLKIPAQEEVSSKKPKETIDRIAFTAQYQTFDLFESQIDIYARAGSLKVESPHDSVECLKGSYLEFMYSGAESDSLWLVFFNNLGEFLSEEKIASSHRIQMQFPKGLYYWQLTSEDEALHTAKIYIR